MFYSSLYDLYTRMIYSTVHNKNIYFVKQLLVNFTATNLIDQVNLQVEGIKFSIITYHDQYN